MLSALIGNTVALITLLPTALLLMFAVKEPSVSPVLAKLHIAVTKTTLTYDFFFGRLKVQSTKNPNNLLDFIGVRKQIIEDLVGRERNEGAKLV